MVTKQMSHHAFQFVAGNLALDFANTVHNTGGSNPQDDLKTPSDLRVWAHAAGLLQQDTWRSSAAELASFKELRDAVYRLFSDTQGCTVKPDLERFNAHVRLTMAQAQMQAGNDGYRLVSSSTKPAERLRFAIVQAAVELLLSGQLGRIRQCAGEKCTWLFLDTSRNGARRWCEMRACGNRAKVRQFRKRLRNQQ